MHDSLFKFERPTRQSREEMLSEMRAFKDFNGPKPAKSADYMRWSGRRFHRDTIVRFFGSWKKACEAVDIKEGKIHQYSDEEIVDLAFDLWRWRGQRPVITDLQAYNKEKGTTLHVGTIATRWGGWIPFLRLIAAYGRGQLTREAVIAARPKNQQREPISSGLRAQVLRRDNYACVDCGASPRETKGVKLHIHHVLPVSKGGKSTLDNLVTNCDDCNLGKSDRISSA
jgi:hypothetical protein